MQSTTTYLNLRTQVRDGDTLAVLATGIYRQALALGAMGIYGHVGIVRSVTIDDITRQMVIEETAGGGCYTPLSHYQTQPFDIYSAPTGIDGRTASGHAVKLLEGLSEYDWRDIARLAHWGAVRALARIFDDPLPEPKPTEIKAGTVGVICSALVATAYVRAGWVLPGPCAWPGALCSHLGTPRLAYRPD